MFTEKILVSIAGAILKHYKLDPDGVHGIAHWGRVIKNGTELAALTGADLGIVQLFALFHDSRRKNDWLDPRHGARGAVLASEMNGGLFSMVPAELAMLQDACIRHTKGFTEADITIQTCWDADRLDLPRVNISPVPELLCTGPAKEKFFVDQARQRSTANQLTGFAIELRKTIA